MKKYISRATKLLAIFSLISVVIFATGLFLIIVGFPNDLLQFGLLAFGGLTSVFSLSIFFAEKSRALIIDADKIVFPRGAEKDGKSNFKKTVIKFNEISSIDSKFYKGDKIITGDCFFHTIKLKDGTKVTVTLYAYGKESEKEILKTIQEKIT